MAILHNQEAFEDGESLGIIAHITNCADGIDEIQEGCRIVPNGVPFWIVGDTPAEVPQQWDGMGEPSGFGL
jgi:hypothetical protein